MDDIITKIKPSIVAILPDDRNILVVGRARVRGVKNKTKERKACPEQGRRVFVAMSGGVDSSVSAALLKEQGYTGVFIHAWQPDFLECERGDDRQEAMRAAAHLEIPFLTFDLEKEYKKEVVDYMIAEYKAGRTPNPDVVCNKKIKFGEFLKKAIDMGADYIATGHYAQKGFRIQNLESRKESSDVLNPKFYILYAGKDKNKDQSYFLWTLTQEQLHHTLFPIGDYMKPEVRKIARKFGLPNAERKESQGLCFVGEFKMQKFLEHFIAPIRGDVLSKKGEVIGWHNGSFYFTLGQRHGFTITKKGPNDIPHYVVSKDLKRNTITVSNEEERKESSTKEVLIENVNFISGDTPNQKTEYSARIRYRQPLQVCRFNELTHEDYKLNDAEDDSFNPSSLKHQQLIKFEKPQKAVTPGQSLVLYDGEECLGGGIIANTVR